MAVKRPLLPLAYRVTTVIPICIDDSINKKFKYFILILTGKDKIFQTLSKADVGFWLKKKLLLRLYKKHSWSA